MTLIGFLAIIVVVTVGVLLRVFLASNKVKKASAEKKPEPPKKAAKSSGSTRTGSGTISGSSTPAQPASKPKPKAQPSPEPEKSLAKKVLEEEEADPVAEAEVFLTYGLKEKAVEVLAKHLANNPSDAAAIDLLAKAKQ